MKKKVRFYNRQTVFCFRSTNDKNEAIDFLLRLKIPFFASLNGKRQFVKVKPSLVIKHCLDLYLNPAICFSEFTLTTV